MNRMRTASSRAESLRIIEIVVGIKKQIDVNRAYLNYPMAVTKDFQPIITNIPYKYTNTTVINFELK